MRNLKKKRKKIVRGGVVLKFEEKKKIGWGIMGVGVNVNNWGQWGSKMLV